MTEVDVDRHGEEALKDRLRFWALGILAAREFELGLYFVEFSALDEYGYPDQCVSKCYLAWDGRSTMEIAA